MVSRDVLEDTAIVVGELATKKRSVGSNKSTQRTTHQKTDPRRDIREWTSPVEKRQGHNQPKGKGKGKGAGKGNQNQDQAGHPDEGGRQRRLNEFGMNRQRVEFVGDVQEHDDGFETPRADRAADVFWCSQLQKRHVWKCQVRQRKFFCRRAGALGASGHSRIEALQAQRRDASCGCMSRRSSNGLTLEVLCPRAQATLVPTEKVNYSMNLESVLRESLQH